MLDLEDYVKIVLDVVVVAATQASPHSALRVTMYQMEGLRKAQRNDFGTSFYINFRLHRRCSC